MFFGDIVQMNGRRFKNKIALIDEKERVTFGEVADRVERIIFALQKKGIRKGDRVAVLLYNETAYAEIILALFKGGFVLVPVNYRLVARELAFILKDSRPSAFILGEEFLEEVKSIKNELDFIEFYIGIGLKEKNHNMMLYEDIIRAQSVNPAPTEINDRDLAMIMYTSGTTGRPKGVMVSHKNIMAGLLNEVADLCPAPDDILFNLSPFYHAGGIDPFLVNFYRGGTYITNRQYDTETVLQWIEREKPTVANLVPAMQNMIMNFPGREKYDLSSLKRIMYGASAMMLAQLKQSMRIFKDCQYFQVGGQTETTAPFTVLRPEDHIAEGPPEMTRRLKSAGREVPGCEVRIVDEDGNECPDGVPGEALVRGDCVMEGYWQMPEETKETLRDGWLHTGDICIRDKDGFIYFVDRTKDMINRGGENVYPREIEEVIATHSGVLEVAVIGVPDERLGEEIKAIIVCKPGHQVTEKEIINLCKDNLAAYKKPRSIDFFEELPKNPSGKILKRVLKEQYVTQTGR